MLNIIKRINIRVFWVITLGGLSLIAIICFYQSIQKQMECYLLKWMEKITVVSSTGIDETINIQFNILDSIAQQISEKDLEHPDELAKSFGEIVKKNKLRQIGVATLDGTAYLDNGDIASILDREYFKASISGKRWISEVLYSKWDGRRSNVFSIPLYIDNEIAGIVFFSMLTDDFYQEFNLDLMREIGDTVIINTEGNIIGSDQKSRFNSGSFNVFDNLKDQGVNVKGKHFKYTSKGCIQLRLSDKNDYILCYSKLSHQELWFISLIDHTDLKDSYQYMVQGIIGIIILIIFLISMAFMLIFNKEKKYLKELEDMAYTDAVTGGHNDKYLRNYMNQVVHVKNEYAFISLEITNIKQLINVLGLKNTEFILKEIYTYLQKLLNQEEIVVHSYLGEYKILLKYGSIKKLNERLQQIDFTKIHDNLHFIIGVYLVDDLEASYHDLCLYTSVAKEFLNNSKNNQMKYVIYNQQIHKKEIDKFKLEEDIKSGIENKEFKAWFQPKYGKDGKTIVGAEALVRWYKYGSIISPYIFVPTCEANGLIKEIDELVFEDVCKQLREWMDHNKQVVPIGVNLSRSYLDRIQFINTLEGYMEIYKIPKELIHFEITESSLIGNEERFENIIHILHQKGFKVYVDDFGIGYSSIKAISLAQFDALKIDKSFIDGIGDPKWENIIKYTICLANHLDMKVIAEGVETKEQYEFLLACNCNLFQGYYFNKPMDAEAFSRLI